MESSNKINKIQQNSYLFYTWFDGDLGLLTGTEWTEILDFLDKSSGFFSASVVLLIRMCFSIGVSIKSHSKLLLLWQLESGLAIGTITGDKVSSSSGSRTYLEGVSSAKIGVISGPVILRH